MRAVNDAKRLEIEREKPHNAKEIMMWDGVAALKRPGTYCDKRKTHCFE